MDCKSEEVGYQRHHDALVEYLLVKVSVADWHGVSDAANDLRVLEAQHDEARRQRSSTPKAL